MAALFAVLIVVTNLAVVFRYLLNDPLMWSDEASRLLLIWVTFMGAAIGVRRGSHFAVALVVSALPDSLRRSLFTLSNLAMMAFGAVFLIVGVVVLRQMVVVQYVTIGISMAWAYLAIPVSGGLMVTYAAVRVVSGGHDARTG
ncbi:MAG: TRAP transporter small permease [Candidatus Rokubacteria bacterium]|nr:TRAP transporter small permease [Candidatus Rokubacteria bacterium]